MIKTPYYNRVIHKVMLYWAWVAILHLMLHPFLQPLLPAKSWNFIKYGYEILRLGIKCTRLENMYSYSTHSSNSGLVESVQEKKGQAKLSFMPPWNPVYFFFFEISSPMWPNTGFWCCLCLTLISWQHYVNNLLTLNQHLILNTFIIKT
jgi:hypothetical protein